MSESYCKKLIHRTFAHARCERVGLLSLRLVVWMIRTSASVGIPTVFGATLQIDPNSSSCAVGAGGQEVPSVRDCMLPGSEHVDQELPQRISQLLRLCLGVSQCFLKHSVASLDYSIIVE